jgi:hypothetical protein
MDCIQYTIFCSDKYSSKINGHYYTKAYQDQCSNKGFDNDTDWFQYLETCDPSPRNLDQYGFVQSSKQTASPADINQCIQNRVSY